MPVPAHLQQRLGLRLLLHAKLAPTRCPLTANVRAHSVRYSTTSSAAEKGTLDEQLWEHYTRTRPSRDELDAREEALAVFQQAIDDYGTQRGFQQLPHPVVVVGSAACGLDRAGAELQLTIDDPRMPFGPEPSRREPNAQGQLHTEYSVGIAAKFLQKLGFLNVYAIGSSTRIPSVRAKSPTTPPVTLELRLLGEAIYASQLINTYVSLNRNIAPMVVFLHRWFKFHSLHKLMRIRDNGRPDVLRHPFDEYTVTLFVVAYLQVLRMLPNLQAPFVPQAQRVSEEDISHHISAPILNKLMTRASTLPAISLQSDDVGDPRIWWYTTPKMGSWRALIDTRFLALASEPVDQWRSQYHSSALRSGFPEPTLSELVQGFFQFWAQFPFHEWAVSVRDGGVIWRGRSSDEREIIKNLENAKLRTDRRLAAQDFLIRRDAPIQWLKFQKAIKWILLKTPDLTKAMHHPVVVVNPMTGAYLRNTTRKTTLEDMEKFMQVCAAASDAIDGGAGVADLLAQSVHVDYAEKQPPPPESWKDREQAKRWPPPHLMKDEELGDHLYLRGADIPDMIPGGVMRHPGIVRRKYDELAERRAVVEHTLRITRRVAETR